jgi:hypothetical protein
LQSAGHSTQKIQKKEYHFGKADGLNQFVRFMCSATRAA